MSWVIESVTPSDGRLIDGVRIDHQAWIKCEVPAGGAGVTHVHLQGGSYFLDAAQWRVVVDEAVAGLNALVAGSRPPTVIIRLDEAGHESYHAHGNVRLFTIDERAASDRVYALTRRCSVPEIEALLGVDPIGHRGDAPHAAIAARVREEVTGEPRLRLVKEEE